MLCGDRRLDLRVKLPISATKSCGGSVCHSTLRNCCPIGTSVMKQILVPPIRTTAPFVEREFTIVLRRLPVTLNTGASQKKTDCRAGRRYSVAFTLT